MTWAGPAVAGGPFVRVVAGGEFARAALERDAQALDSPGVAVPAGLQRALAERCLERPETLTDLSRGRFVDLRWLKALSTVALEQGLVGRQKRPSNATVILESATQVSHVQERPGGLMVLTGEELLCLDDRGEARWSMPLEAGFKFALLGPLGDDGLALAAFGDDWDDERLWVRVLSDEGEVLASGEAACARKPQWFAYRGGWIHVVAERCVLRLNTYGDVGAPERFLPAPLQVERGQAGLWSREPKRLGQWLAFGGEDTLVQGKGWEASELHWLDLESGECVSVPWENAHGPVWHYGELWCTNHEGLWRVAPGQPRVLERSGQFWGVAFHGPNVWLGGDKGILNDTVIEGVSTSYGVHALEGGAVFDGLNGWMAVNDAGEIVARCNDKGDFSVARLGETLAVGAGTDAALFGPGCEVLYREHMPHDGEWIGACGGYLLFGRKRAGVVRRKAKVMVAVSADGTLRREVTQTGWQTPRRTVYAGGTTTDGGVIGDSKVVLVGHRRLGWWRPRGVAAIPRPVADLAPARGQRKLGFHTVNPRDDWPVPGYDVHDADQLVEDGDYEGTWGVAEAPDAEIDSGATVAMVRCTFRRGGLKLRKHSTAFLFDCDQKGPISTDETSFVVDLSAPKDPAAATQ